MGSASLMKSGGVTRFAIANPDVAPYGRAAEAVLRKRGLWDRLRPRLVLGDSIAQAAQFVTTGNAVGGLLAYSLVLGPEFARSWHVRRDRCRRSSAPSPAHGAAQACWRGGVAVLRFVQGEAARGLLRKHGFAVPE